MTEKSILIAVNPPYAEWLVYGVKTIEWRTKPLPTAKHLYNNIKAYVYETKKGGGSGTVIGEVKILGIYSFCETSDIPGALSDFIARSKIGCVNMGKCAGCVFLDKGIDGIIEDDCLADFDTDCYAPLKRPPQSWCYVEEA